MKYMDNCLMAEIYGLPNVCLNIDLLKLHSFLNYHLFDSESFVFHFSVFWPISQLQTVVFKQLSRWLKFFTWFIKLILAWSRNLRYFPYSHLLIKAISENMSQKSIFKIKRRLWFSVVCHTTSSIHTTVTSVSEIIKVANASRNAGKERE